MVLDLEPRLYDNKKAKQQIVKTINKFAKERWQALVKQDPSMLKVATGSAKQSVETDIRKFKTQGKRYHGRVIGTKINFSMAELKQSSHNQYTYKILVQFDLQEAKSQSNGPTPQLKDQKEGDFLTLNYHPKAKAWTVAKVVPKAFQGSKDETIVSTSF